MNISLLFLYYLPQVTACHAITGQASPTRFKWNHVIKIFNSNHPPHNLVHTETLHKMSGILFQDNHTQKDYLSSVSTFQHSFTTKLHSMQDDKLKIGHRFVCVWKSHDVGRIICCNCSLAGPVLKDRYPRYGCWTVLFGLYTDWHMNDSSCQLPAESQVGLCVGVCVIPVHQWEIHYRSP